MTWMAFFAGMVVGVLLLIVVIVLITWAIAQVDP